MALSIQMFFYLTGNIHNFLGLGNADLKTYNLLENSLYNATTNIVQQNNAVLLSLAKTTAENKAASAAAALSYCNQVKFTSTTLIDRLNGIKNELLLLSGDQKDPEMGRKQEPEAMLVRGGVAELAQGDNMELHAHYFMIDGGGENGIELQNAINKTRNEMLNVMKKASIDPILSTTPETKKILLARMEAIREKTCLYANNTEETWASMYLEHSPLAGVFAMLSKVEIDSRLLEAEVMQALAGSVHPADYKFECPKACCIENNP